MNREEKIQSMQKNRLDSVILVLEDISDPHNAQAIVRTCEGLGIGEIYLIFNEPTKAFDPELIGKASSSSANKWVNYHIYESTEECLNNLKQKSFAIAATVLDEADSIYEADFTNKKIALMMGNEHAGLSKKAISLADIRLTIPMMGMVQSFNVSVSAAIFLYEISKQKRREDKK